MLDFNRLQEALRAPTPAPLHVKLRQAIEAQIADGTLKPGEKLPSERSLQEHLSISRGPIREAIRALVQADLLRSVPGTGTFVLEPRARSAHLGLVGLVVSSANFHFFYPQLAAAFSGQMRGAGYGVLMSLHSEQVDELVRIVDQMRDQGVKALAVTPPRYGELALVVEQWVREGMPLVFVGRRSPVYTVDCVATDNETIGYQAARHLIELGHRRIVHIGFTDYSTGIDRAQGYQRAMEEAGLDPQVVELPGNGAVPRSSVDGIPDEHLAVPAYQVALEVWGQGGDLPTAAFCFNDITAMGVYKALRELGLRIPEDVSLVGVDNLPTTRHFEVPLSTFALPGAEIGRRAAQILLQRLGGSGERPQQYLLPARFIARQSVAALR